MTKKDGFLKGGIIGAVAGAVTALLFAPKSGKETRADLKEAANKVARETEKRLKSTHDSLLEQKAELDSKASSLKGKAKTEADDLSTRAEIARKKLGELISAVREGGEDDTLVQKAIEEAENLTGKIKSKIKK